MMIMIWVYNIRLNVIIRQGFFRFVSKIYMAAVSVRVVCDRNSLHPLKITFSCCRCCCCCCSLFFIGLLGCIQIWNLFILFSPLIRLDAHCPNVCRPFPVEKKRTSYGFICYKNWISFFSVFLFFYRMSGVFFLASTPYINIDASDVLFEDCSIESVKKSFFIQLNLFLLLLWHFHVIVIMYYLRCWCKHTEFFFGIYSDRHIIFFFFRLLLWDNRRHEWKQTYIQRSDTTCIWHFFYFFFQHWNQSIHCKRRW